MTRALGVDVSLRFLHVVVLDQGSPQPVAVHSRLPLVEFVAIVRQYQPDVVAIDSPPRWGLGKSRSAEKELAKQGVSAYACPSDPGDHPFYRWMRTGMEAFRQVEAQYPLYLSGGTVRGRAIEVFPHASALALAQAHRPDGLSKHAWRRRVLAEYGIAVSELSTSDDVDAALAAVTGLEALTGQFIEFGSRMEGVVVVLGSGLPDPPARSAPGTSSRVRPLRPVKRPTLVLSPPTQHLCRCGCGAVVRSRYLPGHDAKHRAALLKQVRDGELAKEELGRLGWS
jgi:predicted nuclease with RNAse H fold